MVKGGIIILIVACWVFCGCKSNKSSTEIEKTVQEWTGKEIFFPKNISCKSIDKDTLCVSPDSTPYKILIYTDSTGCTSCKLNLYKWNTIIEEVNNEMTDLVNFQFYFHPKNIEELFFLFRKDSFKYSCYIDVDNQLDKINHFPRNSKFQTFLLDKYNKVVCIGNPAENPQLWDLYKQIIRGRQFVRQSDSSCESLMTSLAVDRTILELKDLEINKTTIARFVLKNIGCNSLIVTNVTTTCGCTVPVWSKQPVLPNEETEIVVQVTPDKEGYFKKKITIHCNIEKGYITLVIHGKVNSNA